MKISKEGQKRTAVAVKENQVGGVVYKVPGGSEIDLNANLAQRSRKAKNLYNIFNQIQAGTKPSEYEWKEYLSEAENKKRRTQRAIQQANYELRSASEYYAKKANFAVRKIIFRDRPKKILSDDQIISNMKDQTLPRFRGRLEDFVLLALRKSLAVLSFNGNTFDSRKAVTVFLENIGNEDITADDEQQIRRLMALIREDYNKWSPGRRDLNKDSLDKKESNGTKVIRSIKNQNMIIQPEEDKLSLSKISNDGKKTNTKQTEKAGLLCI